MEENKVETKVENKVENFLNPERQESESHESYRQRRKIANLYCKLKKKGQLIWTSKDIKHPVEKDGKIIGYTETRGFTYNKLMVQKAFEKYLQKQKEHESNPSGKK